MLFSLEGGLLKDESLLPARDRFEPSRERPGPFLPYSPKCLEKLSEKSRVGLQRSLTGHRPSGTPGTLGPGLWASLLEAQLSDNFLRKNHSFA
jgi:hypothetical protein